MPLWVFNHTAGAFTAQEKLQIAGGMTQIYRSIGLPAFYCHAQFFELQPDSIFAGGESPKGLTVITIYHIARRFENEEQREQFLKAFDSVVWPVLKPKGIEWESFITEAERDLWRINGLIPPETGSDMEKKWFEANAVTDEEELLRKQGY